MTDYEIIGRVAVWIGSVILALCSILVLQWLAWKAFKELIGWPRIYKALKLLQESEEGEKP